MMRMEPRKTGTLALAVLLVVSASGAQAPHQHEMSLSQSLPLPSIVAESFTSLMMQAMEHMHRDMSIVPSGDPDRDFAAMMIPHHQGAIHMAKVELKYAKDPELRKLAEGVIEAQ